MKNRIGHIIALPPGMGKTRAVLALIRKRTGSWNKALRQMLVLGPNHRLERIWLRELALMVIKPKGEAEDKVRFATRSDLKRKLAKEGVTLPYVWFRTYRQILRVKHIRLRSFIIFDEWHRFSIADRCERFVEGQISNRLRLAQTTQGRYGNHSFFVSATPLNPVLEKEITDLIEEPKEDDEVIKEARHKALCILMGLTGRQMPEVLSLPFNDAIHRLGICSHHFGGNWKAPKVRWETESIAPDPGLLDILRKHSIYEGTDWKSHEAAWAIGLVRTQGKGTRRDRRFTICTSNRGKSQQSFGFTYTRPYVPKKYHGPTDAGRWLVECHSRVKRLLDCLEEEKIIISTNTSGNGSRKWQLASHKKVLIFCVHQGVARGLHYALRQVIDSSKIFGGNKSIASTLYEFDDVVDQFNTRRNPPYILIATDKMSESVDLHHACNTLVHYELPWSPLRLFQRVGRLTRRLRHKFNKVRVFHVIIPGSVEEERVNRLIRRTRLLADEGAWPKELFGGKNSPKIAKALIGNGPSLHLAEEVGR